MSYPQVLLRDTGIDPEACLESEVAMHAGPRLRRTVNSDTNIMIFLGIFRTFGDRLENLEIFRKKNGSFEIFRTFFSYLD